jgi:hypothetical protein
MSSVLPIVLAFTSARQDRSERKSKCCSSAFANASHGQPEYFAPMQIARGVARGFLLYRSAQGPYTVAVERALLGKLLRNVMPTEYAKTEVAPV